MSMQYKQCNPLDVTVVRYKVYLKTMLKTIIFLQGTIMETSWSTKGTYGKNLFSKKEQVHLVQTHCINELQSQM